MTSKDLQKMNCEFSFYFVFERMFMEVSDAGSKEERILRRVLDCLEGRTEHGHGRKTLKAARPCHLVTV